MARGSLGFMQLTIICGFSLFYAWYLIAFFGLFMFVPEDVDFVPLHIGQVVFFSGSIAATMAIIAAFHKADSVAIGHTRFLYLASFFPALTLPACVIAYGFGVDIPTPMFYVADFLTGASVAVGFMLWEDLSAHSYLRGGVLAHGVIFCAGGVIFLACTLLFTTVGASVASMLLLAASTALLAFIEPRCDHIEDMPVEPARKHFSSVWHTDIVVVVMNVAFGYAFIALYRDDPMVLFVSMGVAIFADLVLSIVFGRGKWLQFAGWCRICAAFVSCALLLFICPGDIAHNLALCTIVLFWFVFRTMNGGSLADLANQRGFSALYSSTRGKLAANIGFAVGLAVGVGAIALPTPEIAHFYVPLALVAAFVFTTLFFLPSDADSMAAGYKTLALVNMHESPELDMRKTHELVVEQYKLSPRESETLEYLMRGRNAKHIAEKLFISESTAKTHISNIYHKLSVHSQQELLDKLDAL